VQFREPGVFSKHDWPDDYIRQQSPGKSLHSSQVAHQARAYPGFCSMKRLGVFLLPPGWDASPSQQSPAFSWFIVSPQLALPDSGDIRRLIYLHDRIARAFFSTNLPVVSMFNHVHLLAD